jgi:hypothetical protein
MASQTILRETPDVPARLDDAIVFSNGGGRDLPALLDARKPANAAAF